MRISKKARAILLTVAAFVGINAVLCFMLEPCGGSGNEMWKGFYDQEDTKLVYVGTSQCSCAFDPSVMDSVLGYTSYNMGSNMQSLENSLVAIKAAKAKGVTKVVLVVDSEMLNEDTSDNFRADANFIHGYNRQVPVWTAVANSVSFMTSGTYAATPSSINFLFPWIYDRDMNVVGNMKGKIFGLDKKTRTVSGFEPSSELVNQRIKHISWDEAVAYDKTAENLKELSISEESKETLKEIASYCKDNGISLCPVEVPYPTFVTIYTRASYKEVNKELTSLFGKYGFDYYDFNLINSQFYSWRLTDFKDEGHFNTTGAQRFSQTFAFFYTLDKVGRAQIFTQ